MPTSYIQITQDSTFPASSNVGKAVIGVNTSDQIVITDNNGISVPITGSASAYTASYLVYTAKLSDDLSTIIQENTLGFTPTWVQIDTGIFGFDFSGHPSITKIVASISPNLLNNAFSFFEYGGVNDVVLNVIGAGDSLKTLDKTPIEIRQYL